MIFNLTELKYDEGVCQNTSHLSSIVELYYILLLVVEDCLDVWLWLTVPGIAAVLVLDVPAVLAETDGISTLPRFVDSFMPLFESFWRLDPCRLWVTCWFWLAWEGSDACCEENKKRHFLADFIHMPLTFSLELVLLWFFFHGVTIGFFIPDKKLPAQSQCKVRMVEGSL